jgi:hypothetical protein
VSNYFNELPRLLSRGDWIFERKLKSEHKFQ